MMSDKVVKFLVVVCLTLLIWTWAFLSQEDTKTFSGTLEVSPAADPSLLVTFWVRGKEYGQKVNMELTFEGTPAKIAALSRQIERAGPEAQNPLTYYYNPRDFNHIQSQFYQFNLMDFLQKSSQTKGLAMTLESCSINQEPVTQIEVQIEVLEKKLLSIECLNESGLPIKGAITEPAQVEMYVRPTYNGPSYMMLSPQQIELAQQQRPVRARPYVLINNNERRRAEQEVAVTIFRETLSLQPRPFQPFQPPRRVGYILSENLAGKYTVEMDPESVSSLKTINLLATEEAYEAYSRMRYPILIEIRDEDVQNSGEIPPKEIIYNFPREYVARGEIELGEPQPPKTAVIHLVPITPAPENQ